MSELVDLSPGATFADQFKVVRPLARGGMGAVYVVEQTPTAPAGRGPPTGWGSTTKS